MQNELGPDTIFYAIKLKRTKTPIEVFEKMQKAVKKKGVTKKWICDIDNENQVWKRGKFSTVIGICDKCELAITLFHTTFSLSPESAESHYQ